MRTLRTTRPTPPPPAAGLLAAALASVVLAGCGSEAPAEPAAAEQASAITIEDPWVRATEGSEDTSMTAAFMLLDNDGEEAVELVGASTDVAGRTELHEMAEVDGEMVMRQIEGGLTLESGRGQLLQPGGNHIMLMEVTDELKAGDEVTFVLEFADGSTIEVTAPVKPFTEETGHYHEPGTPENHEH